VFGDIKDIAATKCMLESESVSSLKESRFNAF